MRRRALVLALVAAVTLATASALPAKPVPQGPDPAVLSWPEWPYPAVCGGYGPAFDPVAVFEGQTGVENGPGEPEAALRRHIAETQRWAYMNLPERNWRLLAQEPEIAVYGHGRLPNVESVTVELTDDGWRNTAYSSRCDPISIVDGRAVITWTLASEQPRLRRGTRSILINLGPGPCASGRSQNARAMKPIFQRLGKKLLMTMRLRPLPPGGYTCEGIVDPPLRVSLPGRLGGLRLFDGGKYPPERGYNAR